MSPIDRRVAEFIGSPQINLLPATLAGTGEVTVSGRCIGAIHDAGPTRPVSLGIRPEAIGVTPPGAERLTARVRLIEHLGSDILVHAIIDGESAPVTARITSEHAAKVSLAETIGLDIPPGRILLFEANGRRADVRWRSAVQPRPMERVS
jgi:multiple sugar transport system ATP-binding protein